MDLGLAGRTALVTGASQGIGRATALLLGAEGANVAITYHRQHEKAQAVVDSIEQAGGTALAVPLELASLESVSAAVHAVVEAFGGLDILVNNAVQWGDRRPWAIPPFEEVPVAEWRGLLRENTEAAYAAIQAALPTMRGRGWGRIVNVSSGIAVDGLPGAGPYAAAKAAMHGLTRTLAKELGPAGILVNVVMPGATLTDRNRTMFPPEALEQLAQTSPIRRLLPPEEVAPTIAFLCSSANTAVTGEIVRASGGIT